MSGRELKYVETNRELLLRRIKELEDAHGGLRAAARHLKISAVTLYRMKRHTKLPGDTFLAKLGLQKTLTVEYSVRPTPTKK